MKEFAKGTLRQGRYTGMIVVCCGSGLKTDSKLCTWGDIKLVHRYSTQAFPYCDEQQDVPAICRTQASGHFKRFFLAFACSLFEGRVQDSFQGALEGGRGWVSGYGFCQSCGGMK